mmetsp:Transcript_37852/g.68178  ORF Transcript_37852/g.68178 Transcript_37852/m.68178 type:complete len:308 (+) Transcript_37852:843-1766(+)
MFIKLIHAVPRSLNGTRQPTRIDHIKLKPMHLQQPSGILRILHTIRSERRIRPPGKQSQIIVWRPSMADEDDHWIFRLSLFDDNAGRYLVCLLDVECNFRFGSGFGKFFKFCTIVQLLRFAGLCPCCWGTIIGHCVGSNNQLSIIIWVHNHGCISYRFRGLFFLLQPEETLFQRTHAVTDFQSTDRTGHDVSPFLAALECFLEQSWFFEEDARGMGLGYLAFGGWEGVHVGVKRVDKWDTPRHGNFLNIFLANAINHLHETTQCIGMCNDKYIISLFDFFSNTIFPQRTSSFHTIHERLRQWYLLLR